MLSVRAHRPGSVPELALVRADSLERLLEVSCFQEQKTRAAGPVVAELHPVQKNGPVEQVAAASAPEVADADVSMAADTGVT